jgi:peptidoglycan/xylan/chitin deacetylase (PgdA/CDA1 family)
VPARRIAISFDDVPRHAGAFMTPDERSAALIGALRRADVRQAAFFVTTGNLERPDGVGGEARIAAYVRAGHVIANHSHGHLWLHRTAPADYIADLDRAAAWLRGRAGYRPWFRFPYLDEGRTAESRDALRAALRARGLANGYVTVETYDWSLDAAANRARRAGEELDFERLRDLYAEMIVGAAEHADAVAVATLGRSPAHILLLHETDLAALFIADAVAALRRAGWRIVTADEAYADPIAAIEPDTLALGSGRVIALARAAGRDPAQLRSVWTDEAYLSRLFRERVVLPPPLG